MNARACTRVVSFGCRTHVRPMAPILRLLPAILNDTTSRFFSSGPVFFRLRSTHASRCSSKWSRFGVPYRYVFHYWCVQASRHPLALVESSLMRKNSLMKKKMEKQRWKTPKTGSEEKTKEGDEGRERAGREGQRAKEQTCAQRAPAEHNRPSLSSPLSKPNLPHPTRYPLRYAIPLPHLLLAVCGALTSLCHLL